MEDIKWIFQLKENVPAFLEKMKGEKIPGFFRYSLSGDLYDESVKWGLGNTVFAAKIYHTLNLLGEMNQDKKQAMAEFIKSFQFSDGIIADSLIKREAAAKNFLSAICNFSFANIFGRETAAAETRQAISALNLLGEKPSIPYNYFPQNDDAIKKYLSSLDWQKPWHAASHFSHLVFFLKHSELDNKEQLINVAIGEVMDRQNSEDGAWYEGQPDLRQKINGAMKVITALKVAKKMEFEKAEKLIDLSLAASNDEHACDNFNVIYVLKYANELTGGTYHNKEIRNFAVERLGIYKKYYYPEIGGFSFFLGRANTHYYAARITKGLNEPDIHGTVMFLWGISVIARILDINKELGFNEQVP